jgi:dienelactone hydrolase
VCGLRWPAVGLAVLLAVLCAGCSSGSATTQHIEPNAGPAAAAFDTPVHITLSGLPPGGGVTVQAQTRDAQGRQWESQAQFRATAAGMLNLATAVPVSGSYHVADANGLLWSLRPAYTTNPAAFGLKPPGFTVTVQVLADGHVEATTTLRRQAIPPASVQTVRRDGFASTLFAPPKARPGAPAIVVLGGGEGGEQTGDVIGDALALAGYPALSLGYFLEPGLPQCLCGIPLEYFARAVRWLRAQPVARGRPVVLIGGSDGAEAALLIASYEPHLVDAIVANSPSYLVTEHSFADGPAWTFHGKQLTTGALIPVADIRVPMLLSDGGQDLVWPSALSAAQIAEQLRRSADRAPYTNLYYPAAGHTTAGLPPEIPITAIVVGVPRGGSEQANALAAEQFWPEMINFLNNPSAPLK